MRGIVQKVKQKCLKKNDNLVKDNNVYKTKCNEFEKENSQIKKQLVDNSQNSSVHIMDTDASPIIMYLKR